MDNYQPVRRCDRDIPHRAEPLRFEVPHKRRLFESALDATVIIGVILFFALLAWMSLRDAEAAVEFHKQQATRYSAMLAQCMNGKVLFDKTHDTAYFCGKTLEVKLWQ